MISIVVSEQAVGVRESFAEPPRTVFFPAFCVENRTN